MVVGDKRHIGKQITETPKVIKDSNSVRVDFRWSDTFSSAHSNCGHKIDEVPQEVRTPVRIRKVTPNPHQRND